MGNSSPPVQFSYKFEFILCKKLEPLTKTSKLSTVIAHSIVWNVFSGIDLKQKIHFAELVLQASFNFLGASIKSQKWSKREALGSNYKFKDGLVYLDIHFTSVY